MHLTSSAQLQPSAELSGVRVHTQNNLIVSLPVLWSVMYIKSGTSEE